MSDSIVDACLDLLAKHESAATLDITGGAPELHPRFRSIVTRARALKRHVIVRHNLTVQFEDGNADLPEFFASHACEVISSLPHYTEDATDRQRGRGVYLKSIEALKRLNAVGYGRGGLTLNLVANPVGAFLPPRQEDLERDTRSYLSEAHGIQFDRLFTITNMPIARFADWLKHSDQFDVYMNRLETAFNPGTLQGLMCRNLISVSWDGRLFDCDFNQMLDIEIAHPVRTVSGLEIAPLENRRIRVADHCLGCTAGAGSSCGGAIA